LRWIPPGRFVMGSPETEEGRWESEHPPHEVTIAAGFWMFDTPCTQALWEAVMSQNPSEFRSPTRPVEQVSWDECRSFCESLNNRLDGLDLALPSEDQWEYACRAGTETARYADDLDAIAWYAENSGGETHPVGEKQPNNWGLHDMLGNVWEWCADTYRGYGAREREASAHRVIRGGAWDSGPRLVRAAYPLWHDPGSRYEALGFRCAEFREGEPVASEGRAASESERGRSPAQTASRRDPAVS
jgi:formylglycine-generating enzyme required for sulfatase activity